MAGTGFALQRRNALADQFAEGVDSPLRHVKLRLKWLLHGHASIDRAGHEIFETRLAAGIADVVAQRPVVASLALELVDDLAGDGHCIADRNGAQDLQRVPRHQSPAELEM